MIQLDEEYYWLYAAVDPESNELLYTALEPTTNNTFTRSFFADLREKHNVDDVTRNRRFLVGERDASRLVNAVFLADGSHSLKDVCNRYGLDFRYERHGNRNGVERIFSEVKRRTYSFSNCFSHAAADTADDWFKSFAFAWHQLI